MTGQQGQARVLVLDTASLYFRAFFGYPDTLRARDGRPVNAVRGLLDFLARLITEYRPSHLVAAWDNDWRPAWRVDLIPSYKAHRVAEAAQPPAGAGSAASGSVAEEAPDDLSVQVPMIVDVLTALGIAIVGVDDYEADDVIGTLAALAPDWPGNPSVDAVTGDRDLFQIVDDARRVRVLYIAKGVGKHERVNAAWVRGKYGIPPAAYVDFAILRGDSSDGLPGVAGIGEKTAATLLQAHGDLDGILRAAAADPSPLTATVRAKLAAGADYLARAPQVVRVARDLDLGLAPAQLRLPSTAAAAERFAELTENLNLGTSSVKVLASMAASGENW